MKTRLLLLFAGLLIAAAFLVDRMPQDAEYHQLADSRSILGVTNFWNVMTNLPLLLVGLAGLWFLRQREHDGLLDAMYPAYIVFFAGVGATGLGSAWYHLLPNNATLVWDRLPMTVAFMGLFTVIIGEYVCHRGARRLLIPLLLIGAASVFYWQYTESTGVGDLRPYALVQFMPMILIPILLLAYRSDFGWQGVYWSMIVLYACSKLFEYFDYNVYSMGQLLSGHSIKHLVAACVPGLFLYAIARRRPTASGVKR